LSLTGLPGHPFGARATPCFSLRPAGKSCILPAGMSDTLAKLIILGIPLAFSLSWFMYWILKLHNFQKKRKTSVGNIRGRT
jgi:hypothetical protein